MRLPPCSPAPFLARSLPAALGLCCALLGSLAGPALAQQPPNSPAVQTYVDSRSNSDARGDSSSVLFLVSRPYSQEELSSVESEFRAAGITQWGRAGEHGIRVVGTVSQLRAAGDAIARLDKRLVEASDTTSLTADFQGGTLREYFDLIARESKFEGFVFHNDDILASLRAPAAKLRDSSIFTAVDLVGAMRFATSKGETYHLVIEWIGPAMDRASSTRSPARLRESVCLVAVRPDSVSSRIQQRRAVFDLSGLKDGSQGEVQRLLDAVTLAVEFDGGSTTFAAKYHEPSRLLIVKGTEDEIALIRDIFQLRVPGFGRSGLGGNADDQHVDTAAAVGDSRLQGGSTPTEAPPPISDEDLAALPLVDAKNLLARISSARQRPSLDKATADRLKRDFERVLERIKNG